MSSVLSQMLAHVTGGRRYCFVVMGYGEGYAFFERIRHLVAESTGLECIRADDIPTSADTIRDKVHACIENAALVIADVSDASPNIYYEVGYSSACRKPMIALAAADRQIPSDLQGIETISYTDSKSGWLRFEAELKRNLAVHRDTSVSLLRAMIVPPNPSPSYLLASPKLPVRDSQFKFHPRERRTFGDNLGIVGILGAFASVFGEHCVPELLSAEYVPDEITTWDVNLFLIGSPKVNVYTGFFMDAIQKNGPNRWRFERCGHDEHREDYEMILVGMVDNQPFRTACLHEPGAYQSPVEDYGLIMRAPHPSHPARTITIIAGPRSLGTAAACLAATRSPLIREICSQLDSIERLTQHDGVLSVLVRGTVDGEGHTTADHVRVISATFSDSA